MAMEQSTAFKVQTYLVRGFIVLIAVLLYDVGNQSVRPVSKATELEQLSDALKSIVLKELNNRGDLVRIDVLDVVDAKSEKEGGVQIRYNVKFESDSPEVGAVSHKFNATAYFEGSVGSRRISKIVPDEQMLTYLKPMIVTSKRASH